MYRTRTWKATVVASITACGLQIAAPTAFVSAQAQPQTGASDELIAAILRYAFRYDGTNVRLLAGRIPDDLEPNFYVPAGARVLGSVVTGSSVLVLATSEVSPESLREEYTRALAPRGWQPFGSVQHGGFVDNLAHQPLMFCRDGAQLHVTQSRRSTGPSDLYLSYRDSPGPCQRERVTAVALGAVSEPQFPTLYAPPGIPTESRMRCFSRSSGARNSRGTRTMLPTDMSAAELLRHYARQVESAGWRAAGGGDRPVAAGIWTRADSTGVSELTLQVSEMTTTPPRCYEIEMRVSGIRR